MIAPLFLFCLLGLTITSANTSNFQCYQEENQCRAVSNLCIEIYRPDKILYCPLDKMFQLRTVLEPKKSVQADDGFICPSSGCYEDSDQCRKACGSCNPCQLEDKQVYCCVEEIVKEEVCSVELSSCEEECGDCVAFWSEINMNLYCCRKDHIQKMSS